MHNCSSSIFALSQNLPDPFCLGQVALLPFFWGQNVQLLQDQSHSGISPVSSVTFQFFGIMIYDIFCIAFYKRKNLSYLGKIAARPIPSQHPLPPLSSFAFQFGSVYWQTDTVCQFEIIGTPCKNIYGHQRIAAIF